MAWIGINVGIGEPNVVVPMMHWWDSTDVIAPSVVFLRTPFDQGVDGLGIEKERKNLR